MICKYKKYRQEQIEQGSKIQIYGGNPQELGKFVDYFFQQKLDLLFGSLLFNPEYQEDITSLNFVLSKAKAPVAIFTNSEYILEIINTYLFLTNIKNYNDAEKNLLTRAQERLIALGIHESVELVPEQIIYNALVGDKIIINKATATDGLGKFYFLEKLTTIKDINKGLTDIIWMQSQSE